ncbi:hypothetical protein J6590_105464, partial [Homalodisca vitripennis]
TRRIAVVYTTRFGVSDYKYNNRSSDQTHKRKMTTARNITKKRKIDENLLCIFKQPRAIPPFLVFALK